MDNYSEPRVTGQEEAGRRGRPGCITLYAILLVLGGMGNIVASAITGYSLIVEPDLVAAGILLTLCMVAWSLIPFVMAVGLWRMRMWAWWLVVIFQGFAIAMTCLALVLFVPILGSLLGTGLPGGVGANEAIGLLIGLPAGLLISGVILYWFLTNRDRFRRPGVVHVGGRALEEPASDSSLVIVAATVIGVIAILCLVSVAVFALLTLMGPQIGNVFSEVTRGLTTPAP